MSKNLPWQPWTDEELESKWTWVYCDATSWTVYRQVPDTTCYPWKRVVSTLVAQGTHTYEDRYGQDRVKYAAKQREIGEPYATEEWPLRTYSSI